MHPLQSCKLTNMCLLEKDGRILVQMRTKKDWPGLTFPGGHIEKGEGLKEAIVREFKEETGLTLLDPVLCGMEEFKTDKEDRYFIFFYKAHAYEGDLKSSSEGDVFWIEKEKITDYPLSLDLLEIMKVMEEDSLSCLRYFKKDNQWQKVLE